MKEMAYPILITLIANSLIKDRTAGEEYFVLEIEEFALMKTL